MWDDSTGTSKGFHDKQFRSYVNQASLFSSKWKREACPEISEHTTPESWARESWQLAVDEVYLKAALPYGKTAETAAVLSEDYTKRLKSIAENRVAVSGYRLAELMREVVS